MLNRAVKSAVDGDVNKWLEWFVLGTMGLYEVVGGPKGLFGLLQRENCVWVEIATGEGLIAIADEVPRMIQELPEVGGAPLEMLVPNKALVRLYERHGATVLGTHMRYGGTHGR